MMQFRGKCRFNFLTFNVLPQNALVNLDFGFQPPQWSLSPIPNLSAGKDVYYEKYWWDENRHINDFLQNANYHFFPELQ